MRVGHRGGKVREGRGRVSFWVRERDKQLWHLAERLRCLADDLTLRSRRRFLFLNSTRDIYFCIYTVQIMDTEGDIAPENLFRPAKRRKFARRRQDDPEETTSAAAEPVAESTDKAPLASESKSSDDADESTHSTGVVRLRRPKATRKGGIGFSATPRPSGKDDNRQTTLSTVEDQGKETIRAMGDRFQMYTGQAEDVDRHMYELYPLSRSSVPGAMRTNKIRMAYIDAEMAKRFHRSPLPEGSPADQPVSQPASGAASTPGQQHERLPASLGKLHEIDLGQETKLQNIARTEAATRRLAGDEDEPAQSTERVGSPAKSWRNRKRRASADIERDRLVEEILRESKCRSYLSVVYSSCLVATR